MQIETLPNGGRRLRGDTPLGKWDLEFSPIGELVAQNSKFIVRQIIPENFQPARDLDEGGCNCTDSHGTEHADHG